MRLLPLLLYLNPQRLKLLAGAGAGLMVGLGAALGAWLGGWKVALALPFGMLLALLLAIHLVLKLTFAYGLHLYRKGDHARALRLLWLSQVPQLKRYDREGHAAVAMRHCHETMAGGMLQNLLSGLLNH